MEYSKDKAGHPIFMFDRNETKDLLCCYTGISSAVFKWLYKFKFYKKTIEMAQE
jgi:hypothetical protein